MLGKHVDTLPAEMIIMLLIVVTPLLLTPLEAKIEFPGPDDIN